MKYVVVVVVVVDIYIYYYYVLYRSLAPASPPLSRAPPEKDLISSFT